MTDAMATRSVSPMQTQQISGGSVSIGTRLAYLGAPFTVVALEPLDVHASLGPRWIARDERGRGVIVYEQHPAAVAL